MGAPSFLALIFLILAAIQLQTPVAFGQEPGPSQMPTINGSPQQVPGTTGEQALPGVLQGQANLPALPATPACTDDLRLQWNLAQKNEAVQTKYTEAASAFTHARDKFESYFSFQKKLVSEIRDAMGSGDGLGGDVKGLADKDVTAGGRIDRLQPSLKQGLVQQIKKAADAFAKSKNEGWDDYSHGAGDKDQLVAAYKKADTLSYHKGMITTIHFADTKWGPQIYIDTYSEWENPGEGNPAMATTVANLYDKAEPEQDVRSQTGLSFEKGKLLSPQEYLVATNPKFAPCAATPAQAAPPQVSTQPLALKHVTTGQPEVVNASLAKPVMPGQAVMPHHRISADQAATLLAI
jgi:hypothetical protein